MDFTKLTVDIKQAEGLKLKPYTDTVGKISIGYGRNISDVGITEPEAEFLLSDDINIAWRTASIQPWWGSVADNDARSRAMVELVFNLGLTRLQGFTLALGALQRRDFPVAANEFLNSKWATQVHARATRIANMIRNGSDG